MTRHLTLKAIAIACLLFVTACQQVVVSEGSRDGARGPKNTASTDTASQKAEVYGAPRKLAVLAHKEINESSGIASSRTNPGLYWTHNDSGGGPFIYALDERGAHRGVWRVAGATARDWEGIAVGPGPAQGTSYLYIGDIGDNRGARAEIRIVRVAEPKITAEGASSSKANPALTKESEAIRLRYPDGAHDAEALMVHPRTGNVYVVTKVVLGNPDIYEARAPLTAGEPTTMKLVGEISLPGFFGGLVTGGDISPDGLRVALCDYDQGYELVLPNANTPFNEIWNQTLRPIDLGNRKQGEAIGYRLDGRALLATSEGKRAPLIQVVRK